MTNKQKRFCEEYLIDLNATQAAIRAGYSRNTAGSIGQENLSKPDIQAYIDEQLTKMQGKSIASAEEVLKYLTSVVRGEQTEEMVVVEGCGDGCSEARKIQKDVGARDKLKAAELLGKRYGIFTDKVNVEVEPVTIVSDLKE